MTKSELANFEAMQCEYPKHWIPIRWACNIAHDARQEKRIASDFLYQKLLDVTYSFENFLTGQSLTSWRQCLTQLIDNDWVNVPLVYTQVAAR